MGRIRGSNTGPENVLRSALWKRGLRYRVNARTPVGRPDVVVARRKLAVFIDGCFWHGCPDHYVRPRSRAEFWSEKLVENVERDIRQVAHLEELGWRVVRIWEHEVYETLTVVVDRILSDDDHQPTPSWRVGRVEALDETGTRERRHLRELRALEADRFVEQDRHTRKWKKPTRPA